MDVAKREKREQFINSFKRVLIETPEHRTIGAVAKIAGYSGTTVCGWVKDGLLYAVRVGRWLCVPKSGLIGFLASEHALRILPRSGWHRKMLRGFLKEEKEVEHSQDQRKA